MSVNSASTTNFGIPRATSADDANYPLAIQGTVERIDAIFSAGLRSSGKCKVDASQSPGSTSFALLGTPDRVSGVVLPADGLLYVSYRALWVGNAGAAIFVGSNEVQAYEGGTDRCAIVGQVHKSLLSTGFNGLYTAPDGGADQALAPTLPALVGSYTANGPFAVIEAPAGTYDVSIQFKNTGLASVEKRLLRVWSQSFDGLP